MSRSYICTERFRCYHTSYHNTSLTDNVHHMPKSNYQVWHGGRKPLQNNSVRAANFVKKIKPLPIRRNRTLNCTAKPPRHRDYGHTYNLNKHRISRSQVPRPEFSFKDTNLTWPSSQTPNKDQPSALGFQIRLRTHEPFPEMKHRDIKKYYLQPLKSKFLENSTPCDLNSLQQASLMSEDGRETEIRR